MPTVAVVTPGLVMIKIGSGRIVSVSVWVVAPAVLLADKVTVWVPWAIVLPEITPVVASMTRPAGRPVALKAIREPFATMVKVKGWPAVAVATEELVIAGGADGAVGRPAKVLLHPVVPGR